MSNKPPVIIVANVLREHSFLDVNTINADMRLSTIINREVLSPSFYSSFNMIVAQMIVQLGAAGSEFALNEGGRLLGKRDPTVGELVDFVASVQGRQYLHNELTIDFP